MIVETIKFNDGVKFDKIFAKRGDVFTTFGLFKDPESTIKDDKILTKVKRPVLIISNDEDNEDTVRVLALSSHRGIVGTVSDGRVIQIPAMKRDGKILSSYIDVKQEFTINTYQLVRKVCSVSQEIVDTAVALNTLSNIPNKQGAEILCKYLKDKYKDLSYNNLITNNIISNEIITDPSEDKFSVVEQVKDTPVENTPKKHVYPPSETLTQCEGLYKDWLKLSTDGFKYKYKLNKTQYQYLKNKCVKTLCKLKNGFTKYDWKG